MNLPFKTIWPDKMPEHLAGKPNYFMEKIFKTFLMDMVPNTNNELIFPYWSKNRLKTGTFIDATAFENISPKKHTLREDKNDNWKDGNDIHFWINFRTKDQFQFAPVIKCSSVQKIDIKYNPGGGVNVFIDDKFFHYQTSFGLSWSKETAMKMKQLAINDGFPDVKSFFSWFNKDFTGKIIHWTDLKY